MDTRRNLAADNMDPAAWTAQGRGDVSGAVLHVDIVRFSALSNAFAARGQRGSEELADLLGRFFAAAIGEVMAHGGQVGGFAGDAFTAAWEERPGMPPAADRALDAALSVAAATAAFDSHQTPVRCRLSLAYGGYALRTFALPGGRSIRTLIGPAMAEAARLNEAAPPGQVTAASDYPARLATPARTATVRPGVVTLTRPPGGVPPRAVTVDTEPRPAEFDRTPVASVWHRLEGKRFGGTFRDLTVLSIDLAGGAPPASIPIDEIEARLARIERTVGRWGGYIDSCSFEEKGFVLHVIFGLPPVGPASSAVHAVEAALSLPQEEGGAPLPMGVATGLMFFGRYGFSGLHTVSAFGWECSLATRMMQAAGAGVLCDATTRDRAGTKIAFTDAGTLTVKGSDQPVETARPASRAHAGAPETPMFGRGRDFEALAAVLHQPGKAAPPAIVSGPPGIGKTWLCRALADHARKAGWTVAWRRLRLVDRNLPYVGLVGALEDLAGAASENLGLAGAVQAVTRASHRLRRIAPVLQDVVDLGLAPNAYSERLTGEARHRALERLLRHLLEHLTREAGTLLVLDDLQHLDSSSASFLADAAWRGTPLRLVATAMVEEGSPPPQVRLLADQGGARVLALDPLDGQALAGLVSAELGCADAGPELVAVVRQQTAGNPLHAGELLRLLKRGGRIEIRDGTAELSEAHGADGPGAVPESLRGIITARLDQLLPEERHLLQKASCFGELVSPDQLALVSDEPDEVTAEPMDLSLARLCAGNLLERHPSPGADTYGFTHETIRSVAYEMMSFTERRTVHQRIAEHIEATGDGTRGLADLARHWEGAERWGKALAAHEKIAERALRLYAHREAITHASAALSLAERHGHSLGKARRAALLATEALGRHEMMEMRAAEALFNAALGTLGAPTPRTKATTGLATLPALVEQFGRRLLPGLRQPRAARAKDRIGAQIHERLAEIAYFDGRLLPVLNHTLRALNLAERAGETSSIVAGFAALAIGAETARASRLADYYIGQSLAMAEGKEKPDDIAYASLVSAVLHAGRAEWSLVDTALKRAEELYDELGAFGRWQQTMATQLHVRLTRGLVASDDPLISTLAATIDRRTSPQIRMWLVAAELAIALQEGRKPGGEALQRAIELKSEGQLHSAEFTLAEGLIAAGLLAEGRDAEAMDHVTTGIDRIERGRPTAWHLSDGIAYQALVPLLLARRDGSPLAAAAYARGARALWHYQARMPVARQKACLIRGLAAAREARAAEAARWFGEAQTWRERLSLPDDARIYSELARRVGLDPAGLFPTQPGE